MSKDKVVSLFGGSTPPSERASVEDTLKSAAEAGFSDLVIVGHIPAEGGGYRMKFFSNSLMLNEVLWIAESLKYGIMKDEFQ